MNITRPAGPSTTTCVLVVSPPERTRTINSPRDAKGDRYVQCYLEKFTSPINGVGEYQYHIHFRKCSHFMAVVEQVFRIGPLPHDPCPFGEGGVNAMIVSNRPGN